MKPGAIVQPVDVGNDIGKDLYVDLTEGRDVTGTCIALQVKGGTSYRRPGGYAIPCSERDLTLWSETSVPIFGVVFDPVTEALHWRNLTAWARGLSTGTRPSYAPVAATWKLSERTLPHFVREAHDYVSASGGGPLLDLTHSDPARQKAAIWDAFALGRHDPRPLVLLRAALRFLHDGEPLRSGIGALALVVGHMDVMWTADNWVREDVRAAVLPALDWSPEEAERLLAAAGDDPWGRGSFGQAVTAVLLASSNWRVTLETVALHGESEPAFDATRLLVIEAGDRGLAVFDGLVRRNGRLADHPMAGELRTVLLEFGSVGW